jgi:putative tricarboxylic transport membrane protein
VNLDASLAGLAAAFSWQMLLTVVVGVVIGVIVGALPGIGPVVLIALMLPFLITFDPTTAIVLCACIYCADAYGGAITAILINTPGTPSAAATTFDGYPLAQQGRAAEALGVAAVASTLGGLFSVVVLLLAAPMLARVAYYFGPPEYLALTVFGLTMIASVSLASPLRGAIAGLFGVLVSTVGTDFSSGTERFTFGIVELIEGIEFAPMMIGLFAGSELLYQATQRDTPHLITDTSVKLPSRKTWREVLPTIGGASIVGTAIGILPAAGSTIASFVAYSEAKRWSKNSARFGTGDIRGVAAPEAANNAAAGGALVPTLALGIPGSGVAAIILGTMIMVGLRPGPTLFQDQPQFLWTLFAALIVANIVFLWLGLVGARIFGRIALVPAYYLWPTIFVLCVIGSYSLGTSWMDVWLMLIFSVVGYLMRAMNYPLAAVAMGLVLGDLFEESLLQTLILFEGDLTQLSNRPIAIAFLIVAFVALAWSVRGMIGYRATAPSSNES